MSTTPTRGTPVHRVRTPFTYGGTLLNIWVRVFAKGILMLGTSHYAICTFCKVRHPYTMHREKQVTQTIHTWVRTEPDHPSNFQHFFFFDVFNVRFSVFKIRTRDLALHRTHVVHALFVHNFPQSLACREHRDSLHCYLQHQ